FTVTVKPRKIQYGSVSWTHDDSEIFFRTDVNSPGNYQIYRLNVATRETSLIFDSPFYDAAGEVSLDGSKLFVYSFQGNLDNDLNVIDLATLKAQQINDDGGEEFNYLYPRLLPDGKTLYLLSNNNESGLRRLARLALGSPQMEFVGGWVEPQWSVDEMGVSPDAKYIWLLVNEEGYARLKIREIATGADVTGPPLDGMIETPAFDRNDNIYFTFDGPTYAPDVWRFNLVSGDLTKLTKTMYAGVDRTTFSDPTLVKFPSFDGLEIPAFLYLPPDYRPGTPIPFLVSAHGGPESQARPQFARNFQYFSLNGYGILRVNPRGSSGYGKEFVSLDDYKNRKNSLKDYKAAIEWLIANRYTEKGKIGIYGGSYGGYVTLGMITEYPDLLNAAIDEVGIANFVSFLELTAPSRRGVREAEYGPLTDKAFLESISPLNKADRIRTPLLVIHGENDPRVPVEEARQILAAVAENGVPVDSLIFPDEGHGAAKRVNIIRQYRRMAEFFDTHLKGLKVEKSSD
ncbi:MAG TPA: prolyl oligopeptidase family serine peptidase, partial [candidate division Zixibacteria bacterium]|nr:prolyl oligopeptidase family serine peptidase [candidate division Zixibacteria bacterium]